MTPQLTTCLIGMKTLIKDVAVNLVLTILQVALLLAVTLAYGRE